MTSKMLNKVEFFKSIGYSPHACQWLVHNSKARFRVVVAGRRFGKSKLASREVMARMILPNQRCWIVAPSYDLTLKVFREVYWTFHKKLSHWIKKSSEAEMFVELVNGSSVKCKSADNPVSLLGENLQLLVVDEASRIPQSVWEETLRPTLIDTAGDVLLISTPAGMGWFQLLYLRGQDPQETLYESWQFLSSSNPYLPPEELTEAKRTLPERVFRQEFLAEFLSDAGSVFRDVDSVVKGSLEAPHPEARYVAGVDLGKFADFTAIVVLKQEGAHGSVVYFDKFNQIDWGFQKAKIENVSKCYNNCVTIIDSSGVGDSVFDDLKKMRVNVRGFRIKSNEIKKTLIENLIISLENGEISIPSECVDLINELKIFSYSYSEVSGVVKYSSPSGFHDDCVLALALAVHHLKKPSLVVGSLDVAPFRPSGVELKKLWM